MLQLFVFDNVKININVRQTIVKKLMNSFAQNKEVKLNEINCTTIAVGPFGNNSFLIDKDNFFRAVLHSS